MENGGLTPTAGEKIRTFFQQFDFQGWLDQVTSSPIGTAALCFGSGFAIGFLFKKYFKFLLACIFIIVGTMWFLHYKGVITFDWNAFYQFIGFDPATLEVNTMLESAWLWIKSNMVIFLSTLAGFVIGYKLG